MIGGVELVQVARRCPRRTDVSPLEADQTVLEGLYGITITGASTTPLNIAVPVGNLSQPTAFSNPTAQSLTLTVYDYAFTTCLTSTIGNSAWISRPPRVMRLCW